MSVYYQPTPCEECSNDSCSQRGRRVDWGTKDRCTSYKGVGAVDEDEEVTQEFEAPDFGNIFPPNWVFNPLRKMIYSLAKEFTK